MNSSLTREYSQRLGVLAEEQLQAALTRFDLGLLLDAQPATGGLFGQNVFLTTTKGEYVLRGKPHYPWQFPKERYFAQQIHEHTNVPAPWPYLIDPTTDIFGWSYAVMPRLPGLHLRDPEVRKRLREEDHLEIGRALGENLALLHEYVWDYSGTYDLTADRLVPLGSSHSDWRISRVRDDLALCREYADRTTDADVTWVEKTIAETHEALDVPFQPTFVHHDYGEHNVVVEHGEKGWRVSGVFDLMEGYVGDGEEDFARSVALDTDRHGLEAAHAFVQAYRERHPLRPGYEDRFRLYMLADRLAIWAFDLRNDIGLDKKLTFREYATRYVELAVF